MITAVYIFHNCALISWKAAGKTTLLWIFFIVTWVLHYAIEKVKKGKNRFYTHSYSLLCCVILDKIFGTFFHALELFLFTKSEIELDYHPEKVTMWLQENLRNAWNKKWVSSRPPKIKTLIIALEPCKNHLDLKSLFILSIVVFYIQGWKINNTV